MRTSDSLFVPDLRIAALLLLIFAFMVCDLAQAQDSAIGDREDRDRGIKLYRQGDAIGASEALRAAVKRHKEDITAWYYLGLALEQRGDSGSARKAYEQATKLGDRALDKQLEHAQTAKEVASALLTIRSELLEAAESAEKYMALNPKPSRSKREEWALRAGSFRGFAGFTGADGLNLYSGKEVTTKARVLYKPEPVYTEDARKNQITGTVVLRCIFAANGKVILIRAISGLPDGLTESAIRSARQIGFTPATKDGKPVSMWMELQYNFNLF